MTNELEQIAAQVMGCDIEDLTEERYDHYGLKIFSDGSHEYAIGTDEEAQEAVKSYIQDSVWSFRPEFIASHTRAGATNGMIRAIEALQKECESCNEDVKSLIEDIDEFIEDAISADGRGHFLSSYSGDEEEIRINDEFYYAYRLN